MDYKTKKVKQKLTLKQKLTIVFTCILAFIMAISVFLSIWFWGDTNFVKKFKNNFTESTAIPGLDEGFSPQGLAITGSGSSTTGYMFISGYMKDGSPSRLYIIQKYADANPIVKYVNMADENGNLYRGHACGVATNGTSTNGRVWMVSRDDDESTGTGKIYSFNYTDLTSTAFNNLKTPENMGEGDNIVKYLTAKKVPNGADYCFYYSSTLYVGDFYRKGNYPTLFANTKDDTVRANNTLTTKNKGLVLAYSVDKDSSASSLLKDKPTKAYSVPEKIQGMAFNSTSSTSGLVVLSQSYALKNSHLLVYSFPSKADGTVSIKYTNETIEIPLYHFESNKKSEFYNQVNDYVTPCMSEGLAYSNGNCYVLYESGYAGYKPFVREVLSHVYYFKPEKKS